MKKVLLNIFVIAAIFVSAISAFSFHKNSNNSSLHSSSNFQTFSKLSKSSTFSIKTDILNIVDNNEDEEKFSSTKQFSFTNALQIHSNRFYTVNYRNNSAQILSYYSKNLSRVPRFNFLSLGVIRI